MSRRKPAAPIGRKAAASSKMGPAIAALAFVLVVPAASAWAIYAYLHAPGRFLSGIQKYTDALQRRIKWPDINAEIDRESIPDVPFSAVAAFAQMMRLGAACSNQTVDVPNAAAQASSLVVSDVLNGLTRYCAAWLGAEQLRAAGADATRQADAFHAAVTQPPAISRFTTYDRELRCRRYDVLARHFVRPDMVRLLSTFEMIREPYVAVPALVRRLNLLAGELSTSGQSENAGRCRASVAALVRGVVQDEPSPPMVLLCADLVGQTADSAAGITSADVASGGVDWVHASAEAARFRQDVSEVLDRSGVDVLLSRPIFARASYAVTLASLLGVGLLLVGGWVAAAVLVFHFAWGRFRKHDATTPDGILSVSWPRLIAISLLLITPALIGAASYGVHLYRRDPAYSAWLPIVGVTAALSTALLAAAIASWMQSAPARRRWMLAAPGALLALFSLLSPAWSSRAERLIRDTWNRSPAVAVVGAVVLAGCMIGYACAIRGLRPEGERRDGSRLMVRLGAASWVVALVLALVLIPVHFRADHHYLGEFITRSDLVAGLVGNGWRSTYFSSFGAAFELAPPVVVTPAAVAGTPEWTLRDQFHPVSLLISIILTWGIGLTPPVLIRYVFVRRPLRNRIIAGAIAIAFLIFNIATFTAIGSTSTRHAALSLVCIVSYCIMRRHSSGNEPSK